MLYNFLPATIQYLLATYLWRADVSNQPSSLKFELRHAHGLVANTSRVVFSDISPSSLTSEIYEVQTRQQKVSRPRSQSDFFSARIRHTGREPLWDENDIVGPNTHDRETLKLLAKMTNNAYSQPKSKDWYDIGSEWNNVRRISQPRLWYVLMHFRRLIRLAGNQMRTDSGVIYLPMKTIRL